MTTVQIRTRSPTHMPERDPEARRVGRMIQEWREDRGLKRPAFIRELAKRGVEGSADYLAKLEGGWRPIQNASLELREGIREVLQISRQQWREKTGLYVPLGPGEALPDGHRMYPEQQPSGQYVEVPLTRRVDVYPAGTGPAWDLEEALDPLWLPADLYPGKAMIGLRAMGDSMAPYLPTGATAVIVHDDGLVTPGDYVGVRMADDGVVVKRFVRELGEGELLLESLNPGKNEQRLFTAPLGSRIIGPVVRRVLDGRD